MGRRKHREEEHANHERWLVSYADFITLLFRLFRGHVRIVVDQRGYRVLSNSLTNAFRNVTGQAGAQPVPVTPARRCSPQTGRQTRSIGGAKEGAARKMKNVARTSWRRSNLWWPKAKSGSWKPAVGDDRNQR